MPESCVSCTLTEAQIRQRRAEVLEKIRERVREYKSLADGYALRFDASEDNLNQLTHLIQLERQCCAFLRFQLTVEPNGGPFWLEMTGPEGTKEFIESGMELLP